MFAHEAMNDCAGETWDHLDWSYRARSSVREETLTETNLYRLDALAPGAFITRKFEVAEEKMNGADWEWWIGDGKSWLQLLVQAKKQKEASYKSLDHGGYREDDRQFDTLIESAKLDGAYPIHVFYNSEPLAFGAPRGWPAGTPWLACPNGLRPGRCSHATLRDFGCSFMSSELVAEVFNLTAAATPRKFPKRSEHYFPYSLPWSYILGGFSGGARAAIMRGSMSGSSEPVRLVERILKAAARSGLVDSPSPEERGPAVSGFWASMPPFDDNDKDSKIKALPAYAQEILDQGREKSARSSVGRSDHQGAADTGSPLVTVTSLQQAFTLNDGALPLRSKLS